MLLSPDTTRVVEMYHKVKEAMQAYHKVQTSDGHHLEIKV